MAESKRFLLRLDPDLFDVLRRWADDDLRSINAQIEYLLAQQARRAGRLPPKRTKRPVGPGTSPSRSGGRDGDSTSGGARKRGARTRTNA